MLKENKPYDEKRYTQALEELVQQSIDYEDNHSNLTEWDEWDELVQHGYEVQDMSNNESLIAYWWKAWEIFKQIINRRKEKMSVSGLMEEQDYCYPIDAWLQDFKMELGNAGEHERRMEFCHAVLDLLDWTYDGSSNFFSAIGEELYAVGKCKEGKEWFENWLKKEPQNENAWNVFSWCVQEEKGAEEAYKLIRKQVIGIPCTIHNSLLFERAKILAEHLQISEDLKWIESQQKYFSESMEAADYYNDSYDDFMMSVQQPIVKDKKIYPNDLCPCGSGKKYKKCCGKK